jgi:hypothetical protein
MRKKTDRHLNPETQLDKAPHPETTTSNETPVYQEFTWVKVEAEDPFFSTFSAYIQTRLLDF